MSPIRDFHSACALRAGEIDPGAPAALCVLASGSSGNCSALVTPGDEGVTLIDAGLSPTRTRRELTRRGIDPARVRDIVLTHLDTDHCHPGWSRAVRRSGWRATLHIHERHTGRAERSGLLTARTQVFDAGRELSERVRLRARLLSHDSLGVACLRFEIRGEHDHAAHLGVATDVGRVTPGLIAHLRGVDCLAIESNYDPDMQRASGRPRALQDRIMNGSGHLSNQLSAHAAGRIAPLESLLLLHLSRHCNTPELARAEHDHAGLPCVITDQFAPSPWVPVFGAPRPDSEIDPACESSAAPAQGTLFAGGPGP